MLLKPPGRHQLWSHGLPHRPYLQAVDRTLTDRGIPPGIVRADIALRPYHDPDRHEEMFMHLVWDVSRTGARGGVRLAWDDETGWAYAKLGASTSDVLLEAPVASLHRLFAGPHDLAAVAEGLVYHWRTPEGEYGQEWIGAPQVRTAIEEFSQLRTP